MLKYIWHRNVNNQLSVSVETVAGYQEFTYEDAKKMIGLLAPRRRIVNAVELRLISSVVAGKSKRGVANHIATNKPRFAKIAKEMGFNVEFHDADFSILYYNRKNLGFGAEVGDSALLQTQTGNYVVHPHIKDLAYMLDIDEVSVMATSIYPY